LITAVHRAVDEYCLPVDSSPMDVWWTARRRCGGRPWTRTRLRGWARRDRRHAARRGGAGYRRRRRPAGWLAGRTSARHTEEQCDGEHHPQSGNHEDGTLPAGARFRLRRPTLGPGSSTAEEQPPEQPGGKHDDPGEAWRRRRYRFGWRPVVGGYSSGLGRPERQPAPGSERRRSDGQPRVPASMPGRGHVTRQRMCDADPPGDTR
jgi:hypothetical protein